VALDEKGDRSFSFYRNETAEAMMTEDDIDTSIIKNTGIFHFGSVTMQKEPARSTTLKAVKLARENGCTVSYDPNLREFLWQDLGEARDVILDAMPLADIVKLSREELAFLSGREDTGEGMKYIFGRYPMKLLVVTLDADGSACIHNNGKAGRGTYAADVVDTTGAGDAFWGAFLYQVITQGMDIGAPDPRQVEYALGFANVAGTLSTTKYGGTASLPRLCDIHECYDREMRPSR
jgi:fructokinase